MNSEQIKERLEEVFSSSELNLQLKGLLNLYRECIRYMKEDTSLNTDPVRSFKNMNYKWVYAEKLLTKKYPKKSIPQNIFIHLVKILLFNRSDSAKKNLKELYINKLGWDKVKAGEHHDIFKALEKLRQED